MTTLYHVHLCRPMRVTFSSIPAGSPEEAAGNPISPSQKQRTSPVGQQNSTLPPSHSLRGSNAQAGGESHPGLGVAPLAFAQSG